MSVSRRKVLQVLATAPLASVVGAQQPQTQQPHTRPAQPATPTPQPPRTQAKAKFFTAREMKIVRVLADDILPRDERSGSASDAGVPEWMDAIMSDADTNPNDRVALKGGLRWMDTESKRRFNVGYASASPDQRHAILDDISWPDRTKPQFSQGGNFFIRFRDLVATGFFSSATGHKDLRYRGNVFNPDWDGCPPEALRKLGVSY